VTGHRFSEPRLAFLVYRSRSGSTFFGDRLSRHPEVLVTPESNVAFRLVNYFKNRHGKDISRRKLVEYIYSDQKFKDWKLPQENLAEVLHEYSELNWATTFYACCRAYQEWKKQEAKVVVFKKSGWYYKNTDLLLSTFPDSLIICMLRDPRAVYNSACKALHSETKKPMAGNILKNAFGWWDYVNRLFAAEKQWPGRVLKVRYESFLPDISGKLTSIWRELGVLELDNIKLKEILDQQAESHLVTSSTRHLHGNVGQRPIIERAEGWKHELPSWRARLIRLICKKGMGICGYY